MSGQRASAEPYTTSWESTVRRVDDDAVVLGTTYFYAESGGQPADRGTIAGTDVLDVQTVDGEVVHTVADPDAVAEGMQALCSVDWDFRTYCMRAHTASHALYGAARRLLDDLGYGGFDIAAPELDDLASVAGGKVRIDFETSSTVDDGTLVDLERLVNQVVWESRDVTWESVPESEATSRPEVAFNTKTEEGVFDGDGDVRLVTIAGRDDGEGTWDVAACGGTHVRNTRQIGPVSVLSRSNPGEGLTRVEFVVGPPAIEARAADRRALLGAAEALEVGATDVAAEADRLRGERDDLRETVADLQAELVGARLASAPVVERDGQPWLVASVEGVGPNDVREAVEGAVGDRADVVVLTGRDGGTFVVVGSTGTPPAGDVVEAVTGEFGGGGGGAPTFAQGGGLDAPPGDVVGYLRPERDGDA